MVAVHMVVHTVVVGRAGAGLPVVVAAAAVGRVKEAGRVVGAVEAAAGVVGASSDARERASL